MKPQAEYEGLRLGDRVATAVRHGRCLANPRQTAISDGMLVMDPNAAPVFETGIMFYNVTIDGVPVRAGITLAAFEELMARAGFDADRDLGQVMVGDMLALLKPSIEAHLQNKHYRQGSSEYPLLVDVDDLITH